MKKLVRNEKGQALLSTLLFLLIGMLIITPTLKFMGTGITSGRIYEQKVAEIYAADAGVEDAMWHIRYDTMDDLLGVSYDEYDYETQFDYPYDLDINGKDVQITIQNVWIPKGITSSGARQVIQDEKLMIIGYPASTPSTYEIKIVYYYQGSSDLNIKTVGIWLSSGFDYSEYGGSCSLQGQTFYRAPTISFDKGGCVVVWNFTSEPLLRSFPPGTTPSSSPLVRTFTFKYDGAEGKIPELVGSWVDTTGIPGKTYTYSWDDSIRLYKIVSRAGGVQVEAYGAKTKFRRLSSSISGSYFATGNSLIGGNLNSPDNYHYQLHRSTAATVETDDTDPTAGIPAIATIDAAYLYWTGWIDWNTYNPPASGSQTRYPSGDTIGGSTIRSGTWSPTTNMYSYVDEAGSHDGDSTYLLHGTTAGYMLFSFPSFTVESGMAIQGLTVSLVARDDSSGSNNMRPAIRVGGSTYYGDYTEVPTSYGTISYTWRSNPRTNSAWTVDQINGVGSNELQGFGVRSSDASPRIRLTQVYAQVDWGSTLMYPAAPTEEDLSLLVEETARVNKVFFNDILVTADKWQPLYPSQFPGTQYQGTWFYTAKADVTDLLRQWIDDGDIATNGAGTYTVGHVAAPNEVDPDYSFSFASGGGTTGYPLGTPSPNPPTDSRYTAAHAGWSLVIFYSSVGVYNHQFYLYDIDTPGFNFFFGWQSPTVPLDFDNDGNSGGIISGFLVPPQVPGETLAARITVFVGEGDKGYTGDYFKVNNVALADGTGYGTNNVWNGNSRGLSVEGVDVDHFDITWASNILRPMDVSAGIQLTTGTDGFTMSYMLLLFRSELGTGGVITNYAIKIIG